jgi:hypothetical protein
MTVLASDDNGDTFHRSMQLWSGISMYSSMHVLPTGEVALKGMAATHPWSALMLVNCSHRHDHPGIVRTKRDVASEGGGQDSGGGRGGGRGSRPGSVGRKFRGGASDAAGAGARALTPGDRPGSNETFHCCLKRFIRFRSSMTTVRWSVGTIMAIGSFSSRRHRLTSPPALAQPSHSGGLYSMATRSTSVRCYRQRHRRLRYCPWGTRCRATKMNRLPVRRPPSEPAAV